MADWNAYVVDSPQQQYGQLIVHWCDTATDKGVAYLLSQLGEPDFPVPLGVFRSVERPTYEDMLEAQIEQATAKSKGDLQSLLNTADVWEVTE